MVLLFLACGAGEGIAEAESLKATAMEIMARTAQEPEPVLPDEQQWQQKLKRGEVSELQELNRGLLKNRVRSFRADVKWLRENMGNTKVALSKYRAVATHLRWFTWHTPHVRLEDLGTSEAELTKLTREHERRLKKKNADAPSLKKPR